MRGFVNDAAKESKVIFSCAVLVDATSRHHIQQYSIDSAYGFIGHLILDIFTCEDSGFPAKHISAVSRMKLLVASILLKA